MFESLAINLYLARRYPSPLSPASSDEDARCLMWSFWAQSEMEGPLETIASLEAVPEAWRSRALGVLDGALAARGQLVGERFTVADLNVANMFNGPVSSRLDLSAFPRARDWLARCRGRPAAQRVLRRIAAELAGRKA